MRLFAAVDISDDVRERAARAVEILRRAVERSSSARVGWVTPERLHLTLEFIGEVPESVAADVVRRLEPPFAGPPFTLRFGSVGLFPPAGRPRVIWFGLDAGSEEFRQLRAEAVRRLDGVDYRREDRPFSPHLTVGRFREPGRPSDRALFTGADLPALGSCAVDRLTLYQSRLSPRGPAYTPILQVPLGAAGRS